MTEAVVVGRTLAGSELTRLIGYVRRFPGATLDNSQHSEQIREGVRTLLPSTMVPNIVIFLDAFPKTPTGKIDRLALPEPSETRWLEERTGHTPHVPPSNEIERKLVQVWQDALGVDKVSVTDDFHSLGGDSLTALKLVFQMKALGVPLDVARKMLQGYTIRQIASPNIKNERTAAVRYDVRLNLLVNIVRGLLLALVITGHWLPTLVRRLPELASWQQQLDAIFNIATPGFAFVFGLSIGKIYYPKYLVNVDQTRRMFRSSLWILLIGFLIVSTAIIIQNVRDPQDVSVVGIFRGILLFNVLSYYVLAFATAQIWFRVISLFKSEYVGCAVLMLAFYSTYQALSFSLGPYDQHDGPISIGLLIAKFNYFNMSFGVIAGCAAGIYLTKNVDEGFSVLSRRVTLLGTGAVSLGLFILYLRSGSLRLLGADELDMGLWRWVLYSGVVLLLCSFLATAMERLEKWPHTLRQGAQVIAAIGQCTFPIFVLHFVVWYLKTALIGLGIPDALALAFLLVTFIGFSAWCVGSLYRLHYVES